MTAYLSNAGKVPTPRPRDHLPDWGSRPSLGEGIHDCHASDHLAGVQILGVELVATSSHGGLDNEGVPQRQV